MANRVVKTNVRVPRRLAPLVPNEEKRLEELAQAAIKRAHDAGLATTHKDEHGLYELHPDGRRVNL